MLFDIYLQLGSDGPRQRVQRMQISEGHILSVGSFAGSYHVHAMDRHYRDYIVNPSFPSLAAATVLHSDFPTNFSYRASEEKQPSPGVSGNIGEALGGIVGRDLFQLGPDEIVHIIPIRGKIKAPDFIFFFDPVPPAARDFLLANAVPLATVDQ